MSSSDDSNNPPPVDMGETDTSRIKEKNEETKMNPTTTIVPPTAYESDMPAHFLSEEESSEESRSKTEKHSRVESSEKSGEEKLKTEKLSPSIHKSLLPEKSENFDEDSVKSENSDGDSQDKQSYKPSSEKDIDEIVKDMIESPASTSYSFVGGTGRNKSDMFSRAKSYAQKKAKANEDLLKTESNKNVLLENFGPRKCDEDSEKSGKSSEGSSEGTKKSNPASDVEKDTEEMVKEMLQKPPDAARLSFTGRKQNKNVFPSKYGGYQYHKTEKSDSQSNLYERKNSGGRKSLLTTISLKESQNSAKDGAVSQPSMKDGSKTVHDDDVSLPPITNRRLSSFVKTSSESLEKRNWLSHTYSNLIVSLILSVLIISGGFVTFYLRRQIDTSASLINIRTSFTKKNVDTIDPLAHTFDNLADLATPFNVNTDIPFFFHVPSTADTMVQSVLGQCYGLVQASSFWSKNVNKSEHLKVISNSQFEFINIDTTSEDDIGRANHLGLVDSNMVDFISSSRLHLASTLFNSSHKGRMFTLLRHPIELAAFMYHKRSSRYDEVAQMSIFEYANSKFINDNWLTRTLVKEKGALTKEHLLLAKDILKRKCLIGLVEPDRSLDESMKRFAIYFKFQKIEENCEQQIIDKTKHDNQYQHIIVKGSEEWNLLLQHNEFDLKVYHYALKLFEEQGKMLRLV